MITAYAVAVRRKENNMDFSRKFVCEDTAYSTYEKNVLAEKRP